MANNNRRVRKRILAGKSALTVYKSHRCLSKKIKNESKYGKKVASMHRKLHILEAIKYSNII